MLGSEHIKNVYKVPVLKLPKCVGENYVNKAKRSNAIHATMYQMPRPQHPCTGPKGGVILQVDINSCRETFSDWGLEDVPVWGGEEGA